MRIPLTLFAACLLLAPSLLRAQFAQSYNTTLFGQLNPDPNSGGRYSALTGWAAPNGREYALLGGFNGTHIIDVTEQPITQVAFIPGPQSGWREMKTYGQYAYVVSEGGAGLQIIDLSELPAKATLVASDVSVFQTAHTITQHDHYLYINGTKADAAANGGTIILDLQPDPTHPVKIGAWTGHYVHDCTVRNDTLYAASLENFLDIIYLGPTQANPEFITRVEYPGAGTHNADLTTDGSFILTTDEVNSTPKTLKIWDRRDINNITKVADYTPAPGEIVHNVHVKGNIAYVAWYTAGTRVIDVTDPTDPAELGYFDTYPGAAADYAGNWGVYPYLPSGKIISSDMQSGLHVFTFNGVARGNVHGVVRDASTGAPIPGAVIAIDRFGRTIVADDQGRYHYSGAVDTLAFGISALNYYNSHGVLDLSAGDGTSSDILLTQLAMVSVSLDPVDAATGAPISTFSYRVAERSGLDAHGVANPQSVFLPKDSTYHIFVGAWGYRTKMVTVPIVDAGEIRVPLDRGYTDNAEVDLGWQTAVKTDTAHSGRWERGIPIWTGFPDGTALQPAEDHTPDLGTYAFITGIAGSEGGVGANDVDDGVTTLTSPTMDLTSYPDPTIDCALWYSREGRADAINDTLLVMISGNDGIDWVTMEKMTDSPRAWVERHYRVRDYITPSASVLFRIVASDLYAQSVVEAGLDDFAVSGQIILSAPDAPVAGAGLAAAAFHPNPFNGIASLDVSLGSSQRHARVELFNAYGQQVRSIHDGSLDAGAHSFAVDAAGLPSGRYLWRLTMDDGSVVSGSVALVK